MCVVTHRRGGGLLGTPGGGTTLGGWKPEGKWPPGEGPPQERVCVVADFDRIEWKGLERPRCSSSVRRARALVGPRRSAAGSARAQHRRPLCCSWWRQRTRGRARDFLGCRQRWSRCGCVPWVEPGGCRPPPSDSSTVGTAPEGRMSAESPPQPHDPVLLVAVRVCAPQPGAAGTCLDGECRSAARGGSL